MAQFAFRRRFDFAAVLQLSATAAPSEQPELNDVHFHLTNYIQQGTDIHDF
jgi:hypothetical protein